MRTRPSPVWCRVRRNRRRDDEVPRRGLADRHAASRHRGDIKFCRPATTFVPVTALAGEEAGGIDARDRRRAIGGECPACGCRSVASPACERSFMQIRISCKCFPGERSLPAPLWVSAMGASGQVVTTESILQSPLVLFCSTTSRVNRCPAMPPVILDRLLPTLLSPGSTQPPADRQLLAAVVLTRCVVRAAARLLNRRPAMLVLVCRR